MRKQVLFFAGLASLLMVLPARAQLVNSNFNGGTVTSRLGVNPNQSAFPQYSPSLQPSLPFSLSDLIPRLFSQRPQVATQFSVGQTVVPDPQRMTTAAYLKGFNYGVLLPRP